MHCVGVMQNFLMSQRLHICLPPGLKWLRVTHKLGVYITFDTFKGIVLFNPNTSVCLLYKTGHVWAICYSHNQAVCKNKMEIFTVTRFEISKPYRLSHIKIHNTRYRLRSLRYVTLKLQWVKNVVCKISRQFSVTVGCSGYLCYTRMNIMLYVVRLRCLYNSTHALCEQPKDTIQIIGISASLLVLYASVSWLSLSSLLTHKVITACYIYFISGCL